MDHRIVPKTGSLIATGESTPVVIILPVRAKVIYVEFRRPLPKFEVRVTNFEARGPPKAMGA